MSLSVIVKNVANTGEGPHWDERTKSLYYIDISAGNVHQWNSLTGKDSSVHLGQLDNFIAFQSRMRFVYQNKLVIYMQRLIDLCYCT